MLLFDIGANIGSWAIANLSEDTTIISVEASPLTYLLLRRNIRSHKNITPLHYAVTSSPDPTVTFYHSACHVLSTLDKSWLTSPDSRFGQHRHNIKTYDVKTITLDKLIDTYGVPDLLKVDVEGAENIVLPSLTRQVPLLCFEWAAEWFSQGKQCIDHLVSLGFNKFSIQYDDNYTYRPDESSYKTSQEIIELLSKAEHKKDWGMIWAKPSSASVVSS